MTLERVRRADLGDELRLAVVREGDLRATATVTLWLVAPFQVAVYVVCIEGFTVVEKVPPVPVVTVATCWVDDEPSRRV